MNREQAKALLPIIQAYAEGKEIEMASLVRGWHNPGQLVFAFDASPSSYRIKPEKKTFWIHLYDYGPGTVFYPTKQAAADDSYGVKAIIQITYEEGEGL